jgi:hypothetical protein
VELALDLDALLADDVLEGLLGRDGQAVIRPVEEAPGRAGAVLFVEEAPEVGALVVDRQEVVGVENVRRVQLLEVVEPLAREVADELVLFAVEDARPEVRAALPPPLRDDRVLERDEPARQAERIEVLELDLVGELVLEEPVVPAVAGLAVDEDAVAQRLGQGEGSRF